jgi:signal transduction histidine kinase
VVCLADDAVTLARVRDVLAAALPGTIVAGATAATTNELDAASCAVIAATLGPASDGAGGPAMADGPASAARRHAELVLRTGEAALDLRHALNNPLAALLAEAQMLDMQSLPGDPGQAAQRMVELCRRMIALVRTLER